MLYKEHKEAFRLVSFTPPSLYPTPLNNLNFSCSVNYVGCIMSGIRALLILEQREGCKSCSLLVFLEKVEIVKLVIELHHRK